MHAGAGVVPHRALRARPRRVHELGRGASPARPRTCTRCVTPATTPSMLGKAHLTTRGRARTSATSTTSRRASKRAASPRCTRPATSSRAARRPNRYLDHLAERGLLATRTPQHIADRSYQGENEHGRRRHEVRPDVGRHAVAAAARRDYIDTWHGDLAVRWLEQYDRDAAVLRVRRASPGPHDPWDAPAEAIERWGAADVTMPALHPSARSRGHRPLRRGCSARSSGCPTPTR